MSFAGVISGQSGWMDCYHNINDVLSFTLGTTGATNIHQKASEDLQTISWVICLSLVSGQFRHREFIMVILGSAINNQDTMFL